VQEKKKERRREIKVSVAAAAAIQLTSKEMKTILSVLDK